MPDYIVSRILPGDTLRNRQMVLLLNQEGIRPDANLDYSCGLFDENEELVATGSCFGNTLRCLAVDCRHQGEGLMNRIVTHLVEVQFDRGNTHLFLYTKTASSRFFQALGFYEVARTQNQLVFMENKKHGFTDYLGKLAAGQEAGPGQKVAALVMNANPFTLGHLYLVEQAAAENDLLHLFLVSEDVSLFPFAIRKRLITEGTAHLPNLRYHESGSYIISNTTFPSYFQKDAAAAIESHALLDLAVFVKIAGALGITRRYVGEEPYSQVTGIYNRIMEAELPGAGIQCIIIPRLQHDGISISASSVRRAIQNNQMELLPSLIPASTLNYLLRSEAIPVIDKIRASKDVVHY